MTVESTQIKEIFHGNSATNFPIAFPYSRTDTLRLVRTGSNGVDTDITDDYRIDVSPSGDTSVVYPLSGQALEPGEKLTIYRATPQTQVVDLAYGGAWNPNTVEHDVFDRTVMMVQELQEQVGRAIKVSISTAENPPTAQEVYAQMESIADRAGGHAQDAAQSANQAHQDADTALETLAAVITEGEKQLGTMRTEGSAYLKDAADAANAADLSARAAEHAAAQIPGFAEHASAVFGVRHGPDFTLQGFKTQSGDPLYAEDIAGAAVLPASTMFTYEDGRLKLHIPFTV